MYAAWMLYGGMYRCSSCMYPIDTWYPPGEKICPNCGASMIERDKDDEDRRSGKPSQPLHGGEN